VHIIIKITPFSMANFSDFLMGCIESLFELAAVMLRDQRAN